MERVDNLEECVTEEATHGPEGFFAAIDDMCLKCEHTEDECANCPILTVCTVFTDASFILKLKLGDIIMLSTGDGIKPYIIVYDCESGYSIISILTGVVVSGSIWNKRDLIPELMAIGNIMSVIDSHEFFTSLSNTTGISISMDDFTPHLIFD